MKKLWTKYVKWIRYNTLEVPNLVTINKFDQWWAIVMTMSIGVGSLVFVGMMAYSLLMFL